jgi:hypothetical protein
VSLWVLAFPYFWPTYASGGNFQNRQRTANDVWFGGYLNRDKLPDGGNSTKLLPDIKFSCSFGLHGFDCPESNWCDAIRTWAIMAASCKADCDGVAVGVNFKLNRGHSDFVVIDARKNDRNGIPAQLFRESTRNRYRQPFENGRDGTPSARFKSCDGTSKIVRRLHRLRSNSIYVEVYRGVINRFVHTRASPENLIGLPDFTSKLVSMSPSGNQQTIGTNHDELRSINGDDGRVGKKDRWPQ